MYKILTNHYKDDVNFYIENMDTNEIIVTMQNFGNNPLVSLVQQEKGTWLLILDENE